MKPSVTSFITTVILITMPLQAVPQTCPEASDDFDVIDMHAHTFNLRYLPMEGILHSKRVPSPLAGILAKILVGRTGLSDFTEESLLTTSETLESAESFVVENPNELLARIKSTLEESPDYQALEENEDELDGYILDVLESERQQVSPATSVFVGDAPEEQEASLTEYFFRLNQEFGAQPPSDVFDISVESFSTTSEAQFETALSGFDIRDKVLGVIKTAMNIPGTVYGFLRMLDILMMSEERQAKFLTRREFCQVDTFVSHMMDLENVYDDAPDISFEQQIERHGALSSHYGDKLVFFGAYDPFRREDAMAMVEQAADAGAIGIKFYPPSGYRPGNTVIPDKPSWWNPVNRKLRKQWKSRYRKFDAEDINSQNRRFFAYMNDHDLVIFSHHSRGGFEAASDYGLLFGRPGYWASVLQEFPKLRLVIGHAGGGEGWFGDFDGSFSQQAYNLCVLYENVYCDFGFSSEIFNQHKTRIFIENLNRLIQMPAATEDQKTLWLARTDLHEDRAGTAPWIYPITEKMVYGSDWMMVSRLENQRRFISAFDSALDSVVVNDLTTFKKNFFHDNSHRVLFVR